MPESREGPEKNWTATPLTVENPTPPTQNGLAPCANWARAYTSHGRSGTAAIAAAVTARVRAGAGARRITTTAASCPITAKAVK